MQNNKHTGTSMGGTMVYRGFRPKKEGRTRACYQCQNWKNNRCEAGDEPFYPENIGIAERCRMFKGKVKLHNHSNSLKNKKMKKKISKKNK